MLDLKNKVVLITGGTKGLGNALVFGFAEKGSRVAFCARNEKEIKQREKELSNYSTSVLALPADVSDDKAVERFVGAVMDRFKRIDVLVNNASMLGPRLPVREYPSPAWKDVLRVNLDGLFTVTKAVLPCMHASGGGSIINVSSGVGAVGKPKWGAYLVSKFGLEGLSYMLAEEEREGNIRVNIVNPGALATEMRRAAYPEEDQSKLKKPEEILDVFYFLASDASSGITGKRFNAQEFSL